MGKSWNALMQGRLSEVAFAIRNILGRPLGNFNIFPNGFNKGLYILIFFKGF